MCSCVPTMTSITFTLTSCVRGYHVYKDIWNPPVGETVDCEREDRNPEDPYAVALVWRRRPFYAPPENKRVWFALYSALVQSYRNPVQPIKTVYDQLTALLCEYVIQDMSRSLIDIIKEVGSSLGYARLKEEQYAVIKLN